MAAMVVFGCFHDSKTSSKVVHFGSKFWINVNGWIGWIWISLQGLHSNFLSSFSYQEFLIYSQGPSRLRRFQHLLMLLHDSEALVWRGFSLIFRLALLLLCVLIEQLNTANFVAKVKEKWYVPAPAARQRHDLQAPLADQRSLMQPWNFFCGLDAFKEKKFIFESPFDMFWIVFQDPLLKKGAVANAWHNSRDSSDA